MGIEKRTVYTTTDGLDFVDFDSARIHQTVIDADLAVLNSGDSGVAGIDATLRRRIVKCLAALGWLHRPGTTQ